MLKLELTTVNHIQVPEAAEVSITQLPENTSQQYSQLRREGLRYSIITSVITVVIILYRVVHSVKSLRIKVVE